MRRRDDLVALEGYHSPQVDASIRLNTNESPFGPPTGVLAKLTAELPAILEQLNRYPDREALELRSAIGQLHGREVEEVYCANGSNEILQLLMLAYGGPGRRILLFEPTYAMHRQIATVTGTEVVSVLRDGNFTVDPAAAALAVEEHQPSLTFICAPNNPTGTMDPAALIEAVCAAGDGLVVLDEAYVQFASTALSAQLGENRDRVAVVRTFSKTWGMAGLRLGYVLASRGVIADLEVVALPYHLSALTQATGLAAVAHLAEAEASVALVRAERVRVAERLAELGAQVWPSEANFVLFRPGRQPASDLWAELLEASVLVRDFSRVQGLEGCLRVTIGTVRENDAFLAAYEESNHG